MECWMISSRLKIHSALSRPGSILSVRRMFHATLFVLAILSGVGGCGKRLHPVEGQLLWEDGQPAKELEGAMIYFESTEHRSVSRSVVQADGHFQLTTDRPEARGPDGVPPGKHRAYVVDGLPSLVETRFRRPETSGLDVTVPPDGPVELKIARGTNPKASQRKISRADER